MFDLSNKLRLFFTAAILVPVLLYWGFAHSPQEQAAAKPAELSDEVDYFVSDAQIKEWDRQGSLKSIIEGTLLEHNPKRALNYITSPTIVLYRQNGSTIKLIANTAIARDNNHRTDLAGNIIVHDNPKAGGDLILKTEQLTVFPQDNRAESDTLVTVHSEQQKVKGIGMDINFNDRTIDLHSNVEGIH